MEQSKLIEVAQLFLEANPKFLLSGSLALVLQDVKVRREPKDIDIYRPKKETTIIPEGFKRHLLHGDNDEYDNEFYERLSYKHVETELTIDVFTPCDEDVPDFYCEAFAKNIPIVLKEDIIKMKVSHAFGEHFSRHKHKDDIIFMMSNIQ